MYWKLQPRNNGNEIPCATECDPGYGVKDGNFTECKQCTPNCIKKY